MLKFKRSDLERQHFKGTWSTPEDITTIEKQICMDCTALMAILDYPQIWREVTEHLRVLGKSSLWKKILQSPPYRPSNNPSIFLNTSKPKLKQSYVHYHVDLRLCLSSSSFSHYSNKYHYNRTIKTPRSYTHASQNTVQFPQFTRYLQSFHEDTVMQILHLMMNCQKN